MSIEDQNQKKPTHIFTSPVDPDYECVPLETQTDDGKIATPPDTGVAQGGHLLCPEGYVPRKKGHKYTLRGKTIVNSGKSPERNPAHRDESDKNI